jgi:hypothetical protein
MVYVFFFCERIFCKRRRLKVCDEPVAWFGDKSKGDVAPIQGRVFVGV